MHGLIPFLKPPGMTSHDAVNFARRVLGTKRVGHAGTLDPAAAGVLLLAVGEATRLLQWLPQHKKYIAEISFGWETDTLDALGETVSRGDVSQVNAEKTEGFLARNIGTLQQIPPLYSAIKVNGKKGYDRARDGETFELPARTVEVFSLKLLRFEAGETPRAWIEISCGAGFYVRSLIRDLGRELGCGATMTFLVRTQTSGFDSGSAMTAEQLEAREWESGFTSFEDALSRCAQNQIDDETLIADYLAGKGAWRERARALCENTMLLVRSESHRAVLLFQSANEQAETSTFFWLPQL